MHTLEVSMICHTQCLHARPRHYTASAPAIQQWGEDMFFNMAKKMTEFVFPTRNHFAFFLVIFSAFWRILMTTVDSNVGMIARKKLSDVQLPNAT